MNMQFISVFFGRHTVCTVCRLQIGAMLLSIHEYFKYLRTNHLMDWERTPTRKRWDGLEKRPATNGFIYTKLVNYRFYHSCWYFVYHIQLQNKVNKERNFYNARRWRGFLSRSSYSTSISATWHLLTGLRLQGKLWMRTKKHQYFLLFW